MPDVLRASTLARQSSCVRNPDATARGSTCWSRSAAISCWPSGCDESAGYARAWNFGPAGADSRPVGEVAERLAELWPGGFEHETRSDPTAPHEAHLLRLDSSRADEWLGWRPAWGLDEALEAVVRWHVAERDGHDVRALAVEQIRAHQAVQCAL